MSSVNPTDPVRPVSPVGRLTTAIGNGITRVTDSALGPYQSAIIRIGFSATWLLFLLREFPHRRELYGPEGPWSWELAQQLIATNDAFTVLMWSDSLVWFEIVYAVAVLASLPSAARLAHPRRERAVHGGRALAAEPQRLHGRRR